MNTAPGPATSPEPETLQVIWRAEKERRRKVCIVASLDDPVSEEAGKCAIPNFKESAIYEFPGLVKPCFEETVQQARDRFVKTPGLKKLACHQIDTVGPPARVPPRRIPAHFQQEVQEQMNDMLKKGIIMESSSSWLAPAVYTRKKTGEIRLCVDYCEVNKRTRKDAYPLPLIDEVHAGPLVRGYCLQQVRPPMWVLASTSGSKGPRQDGILTWSWNGVVPVHKDAVWFMWGTQHVPETHGCCDARTAICHHLH